MKDATGELSMTAVAVVAIAAILVVFNTLIWPSIKSNITRSAKCSQAFSCDCSGGGSSLQHFQNGVSFHREYSGRAFHSMCLLKTRLPDGWGQKQELSCRHRAVRH